MSVTTINTYEESSIAPTVDVVVVDADCNEECYFGITRDTRRAIIEEERQKNGRTTVWDQDQRMMELCATPGCPMLVWKRGAMLKCFLCRESVAGCAIGPCHSCEPLMRAKCEN